MAMSTFQSLACTQQANKKRATQRDENYYD